MLIFSTFLDYFTGLKMGDSTSIRGKKFWFWLSISVNLGFLGIFKYYNFFAESFAKFFELGGIHIDIWTLKVILPVGISFYTFHGLSYVIDIYYDRIKAERNFVDYAVFVSFFPLLVAGPIERATHLLPQIKRKRNFDYSLAVDGLRQILWGLFKKVVIADQCAEYANLIFNESYRFPGSVLLLGAVFFAFQIYGDFSGYSDIALGTARLFGIELLRNFAFPYFSRDMAEFWRRWHISLSTWFRDYLYFPLGGSRGGLWLSVRNTFIIFLVSGFWHGANWTFIVWGALNALYFMPLLLTDKNRTHIEIVAQGKTLPTLKEFFSMLVTFALTVLAWVFFRADGMSHAWQIISTIFSPTLLRWPGFDKANEAVVTLLYLFVFILIEWSGREQRFALERFGFGWRRSVRLTFYLLVCCTIFYFSGNEQQFIYFQF